MERKLSKTAILLLQTLDDSKAHLYEDVAKCIENPNKADAILKNLIRDGYIRLTDQTKSYMSPSLVGSFLEITNQGNAQLEFDEEEIDRYTHDIKFTNEQLFLLKDQVQVSKEASSTADKNAKEANKLSGKANMQSWVAIVISGIALLLELARLISG